MDSEERKRHHEYLTAKKENDEALGKVYRKYYKGEMNAGQLRQLAGRQREGNKERKEMQIPRFSTSFPSIHVGSALCWRFVQSLHKI